MPELSLFRRINMNSLKRLNRKEIWQRIFFLFMCVIIHSKRGAFMVLWKAWGSCQPTYVPAFFVFFVVFNFIYGKEML